MIRRILVRGASDGSEVVSTTRAARSFIRRACDAAPATDGAVRARVRPRHVLRLVEHYDWDFTSADPLKPDARGPPRAA